MRRFAVAIVAVSVSYGSAGAADMIQETGSRGFEWSGFYIGAGVGAGAAVHEVDLNFIPASLNGIGGEGVYGEVAVGYDHMVTDRFLIGVFANARYGDIKSTVSGFGFSADATLDTGYDLGARAGMLLTPTTLGYVLGGYSHQSYDVAAPGFSYDWETAGFVVGAGLETVINNRLTAKIEYAYRQYEGHDFGTGGAIELPTSTHTVLLGLNYRFGADAAAPGPGFVAATPSWTGFFVSGSVGAAGLVHELSSPLIAGSLNGLGAEGVFGTIGAGYDHEFGNGMVAGIEARGRLSGVSTSLTFPGFDASVDEEYGFDVVGRLGYKLTPSALIYGLAGYSFAHFNVDATSFGSVYDWDANGYVVGAGMEIALSDHLFAGLEYRYAGYEDEDIFDAGLLSVGPSSHSGQLTLKYKF
ncbi:outer membrane immunogenic protein [Hoeflea marina]|uniref:Outer membrane immunogenic protein n=2 Tax=Hoeflea marina TaxID=274592 RepID=A0A317PTH2_9HYPH|nr:outer membrane immunogenic protein [Hoeflea marina]